MYRSLLYISCLCLLAATSAKAECDKLTLFGQPVSSVQRELIVICHTGQVVAFNPKYNVSDWVAYRLRQIDLLNPKVKRKNNFHQDHNIPKQHRVVYSDYSNTGYDRGHFAPAAAMRWSLNAMNDSFLMTNIAPQVGSGFNQHIWKSLERKMRQWACERGTLYIVTGPLYDQVSNEKLMYDRNGDGRDDNGILVTVPSHFFKLAYDPHKKEAIAFILPNRKLKTSNLPLYLTSIDAIEARSSFDFLSRIKDGIEQVLESHVQQRLWQNPKNKQCKKLR